MSEIRLPEGTERAEHFRIKAEADLADIEPWLPERVESVLDIGCGLGLIDVLLARRWPEAKFTLLDGDPGTGERRHGWNEAATEPWANVHLAIQIMFENGHPWANIRSASWPERFAPYDLVVSLLSWGFHYPVETYLPMVVQKMSPGGRLVIDIRHGKDEIESLVEHFRPVGNVSHRKFTRFCFEPWA